MTSTHPMWLTGNTPLRGRTLHVVGEHRLLDSVRSDAAEHGLRPGDDEAADVVFTPAAAASRFGVAETDVAGLGPEGFVTVRTGERTVVAYGGAAGALYGWFQLLRDAAGHEAVAPTTRCEPERELRMLDHWDNVAVHPVMGQVERGYAGGSIFFDDGRVREDLARVERYARLLASIGINRVAINNVNVHAREARLLTDDLPAVAGT